MKILATLSVIVVAGLLLFIIFYTRGIQRFGVPVFDGMFESLFRQIDDGRPLNGTVDIFSSRFDKLFSIHLDETRRHEVRVTVVEAPQSESAWLNEFVAGNLRTVGGVGEYLFPGRLVDLGRVLETQNKRLSGERRRLRAKFPRLPKSLPRSN